MAWTIHESGFHDLLLPKLPWAGLLWKKPKRTTWQWITEEEPLWTAGLTGGTARKNSQTMKRMVGPHAATHRHEQDLGAGVVVVVAFLG